MATTGDYKRALETACREYERLQQQRTDLERRLTQLHETINALVRLCGYTPTVPWGITDAVRVVLMRANEPMTPLDVRDRLRAIGFDLSKYASDLATIHTVLKRLNRAGQAHLISREHGTGAYRWARIGTVVLDNPHAPIPFNVFSDFPKSKRSRD